MRHCKERRSRRIADTVRHKKRLIRIVKVSGYPGPYVKKSGAVIKSTRGKISKYLKRRADERLRRDFRSITDDDSIPSGMGYYRRHFDYWWELT